MLLNCRYMLLKRNAEAFDIIAHIINPIHVGNAKETAAQSLLWVSFFIVSKVAAHGQWKRENIIVHSAVTQVHPLSMRTAFS